MVDQRQRGLDPAQALDHHPRRGVVERRARDDDTGQHADDQSVEHGAQRRHVGGAHVAVALGVGERPERRHQLADVGIVGGTRRELDDDRLDGVGEMGEQRQVEGGRQLEQAVGVGRPARRAGWSPPARRWCRARRARRGAPTAPAPRPPARSRGTSRSCRGPPRVHPIRRRGRRAGAGGATWPARSACAGRARPPPTRHVASAAPGVGGRAGRGRAAPAAHPAGTSPIASPTTRRRRTSGRPPITASAESSTSSRPGRGRPRSTDSVSAIRDAAMRWSGEAAMPAPRSRWAASTKNRVTPSGPG